MGDSGSLGHLEQLIMWSLVRLRDKAYGVSIQQDIEERAGKDVSLGSIYTTLSRLEEKGLVSSRLGEPSAERGGRAKKFFRIEAAGATALSESRRALTSIWSGLRPLKGTAL